MVRPLAPPVARGFLGGGGWRFGTETRGRLHKDWVEFESGTAQNRPEHLPLPFSDPGADVAVTMEPSTSDARRGAMNRKVCDGACRRTGNRSRHFQLELGQREANGEREREAGRRVSTARHCGGGHAPKDGIHRGALDFHDSQFSLLTNSCPSRLEGQSRGSRVLGVLGVLTALAPIGLHPRLETCKSTKQQASKPREP